MIRSSVYDAVDSAENRTPAFVMKRDDDAGVGKILQIEFLLTAERYRQDDRSINSSYDTGVYLRPKLRHLCNKQIYRQILGAERNSNHKSVFKKPCHSRCSNKALRNLRLNSLGTKIEVADESPLYGSHRSLIHRPDKVDTWSKKAARQPINHQPDKADMDRQYAGVEVKVQCEESQTDPCGDNLSVVSFI
ncbi:hypothetical protein Baya_13711 [Bagarius yarrelli]|uniref:Uncharacterized protein n=1 Tax=Bagarius yarrelli TaxID=175774 RepID=A0A556V6W7_BAGYA|nr:hypothetical protein Baya_13711 [Bagarius yarrelli]